MGLDIFLNKVVKEDRDKYNNLYQDYSLQEYPKLNIFLLLSQKIKVKYFNYEKAFKDIGLDINNYTIQYESHNGIDSQVCFIKIDSIENNNSIDFNDLVDDTKLFKNNENTINFYCKNLPTFEKEENIIYGKEIGYQRNSLNSKFYKEIKKLDDNEQKINDFIMIVEKKEAVKFVKKYAENVKSSTKDLLDKFIDGETFIDISF